MRIWDIHPGYLDRSRLLGEHRELHGLASIHLHNKKGYAAHPETKRWREHLGALAVRHGWLVAELALRGYRHHSPLPIPPNPAHWPPYLDAPSAQITLLRAKYAGQSQGRIPLPEHPQQAWAQHKYSILARDPNAYRDIGKRLVNARHEDLAPLLDELTDLMRHPPSAGGVLNAIEHMWGHVRKHATPEEKQHAQSNPAARLACTQRLAQVQHETYLWHSTALSEMRFWLDFYAETSDTSHRTH